MIYEVGWATLAGLAMIVVIVMADAFAFRAEARGEALVPGGVLFVFIAALGSDRMRRRRHGGLLIAAGIVAVVALRALHDRTRQVELTTARPRRRWSCRRRSAPPSPIAIAGRRRRAAHAGRRRRAAVRHPWPRRRHHPVISPLVDIRSRLVNHGNVELFRVNADAEAYWRVTTLPEFDGAHVQPARPLARRVDDAAEPDGGDRTIRQQLQILALEGS